jgi:F-box domain
MPFLDLPVEIQRETLSHLGYKSFTHVIKTCRQLRNLPSQKLARSIITKSEMIYSGIFFLDLVGPPALPCYGCLAVLPSNRFYNMARCSDWLLGKCRSQDRLCLAYDEVGGLGIRDKVKAGRWEWFKWWMKRVCDNVGQGENW